MPLEEVARQMGTNRNSLYKFLHEELDQYAEFVLAGKDVSAAMPLVEQHLEHCPDYREEFEMLLNATQSVSK